MAPQSPHNAQNPSLRNRRHQRHTQELERGWREYQRRAEIALLFTARRANCGSRNDIPAIERGPPHHTFKPNLANPLAARVLGTIGIPLSPPRISNWQVPAVPAMSKKSPSSLCYKGFFVVQAFCCSVHRYRPAAAGFFGTRVSPLCANFENVVQWADFPGTAPKMENPPSRRTVGMHLFGNCRARKLWRNPFKLRYHHCHICPHYSRLWWRQKFVQVGRGLFDRKLKMISIHLDTFD